MTVNQFLYGLNEVEDRYILEADIFTGRHLSKKRVVRIIFKTIGSVCGIAVFLTAMLFMSHIQDGQPFQPGAQVSEASPLPQSGEESALPYGISIDGEGVEHFLWDDYRHAYSVLTPNPVLTGEEAAAFSENTACVRVVTILDLLDNESSMAGGEKYKNLWSVYRVSYGFFEEGGRKTVKPLLVYNGIVGLAIEADLQDWANVRDDLYADGDGWELWYPDTGSPEAYRQSITDFLELTDPAEQSIVPEKAMEIQQRFESVGKGHVQALLGTFMEQAGLTEYVLEESVWQ